MAKTDLAKIDAELAEKAKALKQQLGAPETKKITIDQQGNFIAPGGANLGNELNICVVDFCSKNTFYDRPFVPGNPAAPACIAIGRELADMYPEEESPVKQNDICASCPQNQWGSSGVGNGKACKNTRELAITLIDELEDPDAEPELMLLSLAPTSIKGFDSAAMQAARLYNGPPIKAIFTITTSQPANANYWVVNWSQPEANKYLPRVYPHMEAAEDLISRLPDMSNYEPPSAKQTRAPARQAPPARGARR